MGDSEQNKNIDWDAIAARLQEPNNTKIQTGAISAKDWTILKAAAAVKRQSVAALSASLLTAQIRRWETSWFESIRFKAVLAKKRFEDMFVDLVTGDDDAQSRD